MVDHYQWWVHQPFWLTATIFIHFWTLSMINHHYACLTFLNHPHPSPILDHHLPTILNQHYQHLSTRISYHMLSHAIICYHSFICWFSHALFSCHNCPFLTNHDSNSRTRQTSTPATATSHRTVALLWHRWRGQVAHSRALHQAVGLGLGTLVAWTHGIQRNRK